jgi:hypothetical protein
MWLLFFQDTNGLLFKVCVGLGWFYLSCSCYLSDCEQVVGSLLRSLVA